MNSDYEQLQAAASALQREHQPSSVFDAVRQFHDAFDLPVADTPRLPDDDSRVLRIRLLHEEWREYLDAERDADVVAIADALADIIYIACGTALAYGIPLADVFAEVHRSNMSKLPPDGEPRYRDDGKVLKGDWYEPADVAGVMEVDDG